MSFWAPLMIFLLAIIVKQKVACLSEIENADAQEKCFRSYPSWAKLLRYTRWPSTTSNRCQYNNNLTINCLLLLLGGDIELNLGDKCDLCSKTVKSNQRGIQCDECDSWYHAKCCEVSKELYNVLANSPCIWLCPRCTLPNFTDLFLEDPLDKVLSTNSFDLLQKLDGKDGEQNSSLSPLPEVHQNWKPMKRRTELPFDQLPKHQNQNTRFRRCC